MYLVELDPIDGLVKTDGPYDGILSIKAFRDLINDPTLGRKAMTAVALVVDWQSPLTYMIEKDKPKKAMYYVAEDREAFVWKQDKIQLALSVYSKLQYSQQLEKKRTLESMVATKLHEIGEEKDSEKQVKLFKQLDTIEAILSGWHKENDDKDLYADGPVLNGHKLSRLEEKVLDKHSFYNAKEKT